MSFSFNAAENSFTLDLSSSTVSAPKSTLSPIDAFYGDRREALLLASNGSLNSDEARPLALVPLFSAAEMYFRRFIAKALEVCPHCAEAAGTQQVALGALSALDKSEISFAIAEHQGFTSEGEIARRTNKVLAIDVNRGSSLKMAISEFEALCHLRHAVVHCGGDLMYLNRRSLGISSAGRLRVNMNLGDFQGVVAKVSNVVRSYNSFVGTEIAKRWLRESYVGASWSKDRYKFTRLVDMLWSSVDMGAAPQYRELYSLIKASV